MQKNVFTRIMTLRIKLFVIIYANKISIKDETKNFLKQFLEFLLEPCCNPIFYLHCFYILRKNKKIQKKYVFSINLVNFIDFFIVFMLKNNKIYLESKLDQ